MTKDQSVERLTAVLQKIAAAEEVREGNPGPVTLVAVSKTFDADAIRPVIAAGARVFGENKVQEAQEKWPALKAEYPDIELRLLGPLQSNKARDAVALFDVIESVDREKIAAEISREIARQGRSPRLYVQVNTGREPQKAGIDPDEAIAFVERCRDVHGLTIEGLMCIPPAGEDPAPHFELLAALADKAGLARRSMGMSGDYEKAVIYGATSVRVGSAIFGARTYA
ncbi:YggS family pyridoxal phosphate-dependent enzyme [Stappia sp. 28M-7]|uniref:YggS family pyridoxal phosphate-dependent enzyme n=1 Tax=Stappia sp. 28M-7 TaxID=2762596 RepID=UPI00163D0645|nr:YggS family pyridoxal phosphate-dependent enzyme [Stappia sp. 28M-7]MBC2859192.1 YggS family pyridoxal phosphate-dependent enzyme [Stappia sp. 28M-7]